MVGCHSKITAAAGVAMAVVVTVVGFDLDSENFEVK